mgnify:CR=1 FL=1
MVKQWYEENPKLLERDKVEMRKFFPNFTLDKLDDGRLFWIGELCPGIYEMKYGSKKSYTVMVVYANNYPCNMMGSSLRIYPVLPDAYDIFQEIGFKFNILRDSSGLEFFCSLESNKFDDDVSPVYILTCAMKLYCGIDLILTGDLTEKEIRNKYWFYGR